MKKIYKLLLIIAFAFSALIAKAGTYHDNDKTALRAFLIQVSAESGKTNGLQLGLTAADMTVLNGTNWLTNESWITKVVGLTWNTASSKRITTIYWNERKLTGNLDLGGCLNLKVLHCNSNSLASLDVSKNTVLEDLKCYENPLTSLDVSKNPALTTLECQNNQLTSLDITKNTALEVLFCFSNQLTTLDVTKNLALEVLFCDNNPLTSLDVSKNAALKSVYCYDNQLTSLDVTKNTALEVLFCFNNQLTSLDVTKNAEMYWLSCFYNRLTSLDISKNTALTDLECAYNQLSNLDISKNTALTRLLCENNQLTNLDVTKNTALTNLDCSKNKLKFSTLSQGSYSGIYTYAPQDTLRGDNVEIEGEIDLSSEYNIAGNTTVYKWFDGATEIPASEYTAANGKFTFANTSFLGKTLRCKMTNAKFSNFDTKPLVYQVKITEGTSIAQIGNSKIKLMIYPNPSCDELRITFGEFANSVESGKLKIEKIQMFDMTGKQVFETCKTEFNISHLPNGIYFLKIGNVVNKVVKQ